MKAIPTYILAALLVVPNLARAEHGLPSATSIPERVAQYQHDLDELADEYFLEPGEVPNFDEPRFNRLVGHARILLEHARISADRGDVCQSITWLSHSVRVLDQATNFAISANMSGSGHSDDLASLSEFRAETLLEDTLVLAGDDVPLRVFTLALAMEEVGDEEGNNEEGDWATAVRAYAVGVCALFRNL